jgi:hypothetical protein
MNKLSHSIARSSLKVLPHDLKSLFTSSITHTWKTLQVCRTNCAFMRSRPTYTNYKCTWISDILISDKSLSLSLSLSVCTLLHPSHTNTISRSLIIKIVSTSSFVRQGKKKRSRPVERREYSFIN